MKLRKLAKAVTKTNKIDKSATAAQGFRFRTGIKAGEYRANYGP